MAAKVNKGFVFILFTIIVLLTAGVGAVYFLKGRENVAEIIARGDTNAAQGEWLKAYREYKLAVQKRKESVPLILKLGDATSKVPVSNIASATGMFNEMLQFYGAATNAEPTNPEPLEKLLNLYQLSGEELGNPDAWDAMYRLTQSTLERVPGNEVALRYRGIAQVNRMRFVDISPEDVAQAGGDLEAALARHPDDRRLTIAKATWNIMQAKRMDRPGGDMQRAEMLRKEARTLVSEASAKYPDDLQRQVDQMVILQSLQDMDAVSQVANNLEAELLKNPSPEFAISVAEALMDIERDRSNNMVSPNSAVLDRIEKLIRSTLDAAPDDIRLKIILAQLVSRTNPDEALSILKSATETKLTGTPIEFLRSAHLATIAKLRYAEQLVSRTETSTNPVKRAEMLKLANEYVSKLASEMGAVAPVNLLQGRVLLLNGKPLDALTKLDLASSQYQDTSPEALFYSAKARSSLNELGSAADRLNRLIDLRPSFTPAYYELARIHLAMKQNDEARRIINRLLLERPNDTDALRLNAVLLTQMGQKEQAISVFKQLNPRDNPEITVAMARLYKELDRDKEAIALLEEQVALSPTDVLVLQELVRLTNDINKKRAYLAAARKAGATGTDVDLIEAQALGSQDAPAKVVESMIDEEKDPFRRLMSRYSLYIQLGRYQEARAQLAEAARLQPDSEQVLDAQFQFALQDNDLATADNIASKAAKLNIDQAQGKFYLGRLELARNRPEQAAGVLRQATAQRPVYSEGHRLLGDALTLSGDQGGAIAAYETALKQRPNNAEAYRGLAGVYSFQGEHVKALKNLKQAYELNPEGNIVNMYLQYEEEYGDKQQALTLRRKLLESDPGNQLNRRMLAVLLVKMGQNAEADKIVDDILKDGASDISSIAVAAHIRRLQGKTDDGRALIQNYINAKGDKAELGDWIMLARYLRDTKDWDATLAAYRQAVALENPRFQPATREMTDLLFDLNQYKLAIDGYQKLYRLNPGDKLVGLRLAESMVRDNQPDRASEVLTKLSKDFKPDASSLLLEAMIARTKGNVSVAMEKLAAAEALEPNRATIYLERAVLLASNPSHDNEVFKNLNKALEIQPNFTPARMAMAAAFARRGDFNEAIHELVVVLEREPGNDQARMQLASLYLQTRQFIPLRKVLEEGASLQPKDATWIYMQAKAALEEKKTDVYQQKLREAYSLSKAPQILSELALSYIDGRKYRDAIAVLEAESNVLGKSSELQALMGRAQQGLNQVSDAKATFKRAIDLSRDPGEFFYVVRQMVATQGAQATITELEPLAEESSPRKDTIQIALARLWSELKAYDKALGYLRPIDRQMSKDDPLRVLFDKDYAYTLHRNGNVEESRAVYTRIVDRSPKDPIALNNLAFLLAVDLNNPKEALPYAQRAFTLMPEDAGVLDTMGWVQFLLGQRDEAYDLLRKSVDLKPFSGNTYHLALVYIARGDTITGRKMLDSAKRLAEQSKEEDWLLKVNAKLKELGS